MDGDAGMAVWIGRAVFALVMLAAIVLVGWIAETPDDDEEL